MDNWCLKRHLNTHLKPFACTLCEYKAARAERLATHVLCTTDDNAQGARSLAKTQPNCRCTSCTFIVSAAPTRPRPPPLKLHHRLLIVINNHYSKDLFALFLSASLNSEAKSIILRIFVNDRNNRVRIQRMIID